MFYLEFYLTIFTVKLISFICSISYGIQEKERQQYFLPAVLLNLKQCRVNLRWTAAREPRGGGWKFGATSLGV